MTLSEQNNKHLQHLTFSLFLFFFSFPHNSLLIDLIVKSNVIAYKQTSIFFDFLFPTLLGYHFLQTFLTNVDVSSQFCPDLCSLYTVHLGDHHLQCLQPGDTFS